MVDGNASNYIVSCPGAVLTITPAPITITTGSAEKVYDGSPLTNPEAAITGLIEYERESVRITATGKITDVGSAVNTYVIDWGDVLAQNYKIVQENLGTLTVTSGGPVVEGGQ